MRGTTDFQDLDRGAGSKRAHKGGGGAQSCAPGSVFQGFRSVKRLQNELKKGGGAQPYAWDTVVPGFRSWRRLRKGRNTNIIF